MHRHDTYAIGLTLAGVQCFHYRRSLRSSLPRSRPFWAESRYRSSKAE